MIKLPLADGTLAIAPSILSADLVNLGSQIGLVKQGMASWLHIDIMDGHFVHNLSFGPATVKWIDGLNVLPQDVHLMVENPEIFIDPFIKAGASGLTLHIESKGDIKAMLEIIKSKGVNTGISIKPDTDPKEILPYIDLIDLVLVMTVYPGFGGQGFLETAPAQIQGVRDIIDESGRKIWLEVDGGINKETAQTAVRCGADALVAGNAVFCAQDIVKAVTELREKAVLAQTI